MIGPPGYGDARFISLRTPLNYKIRFENDPNATAPAQHVIILHTLDQDLDIRTFRITGFGFGNFIKKLPNSRAFLQVRKLVDWSYAPLPPGGDSDIKRTGFILEKFEKSHQEVFVSVSWNFFTPYRFQFLNNNLSPVIFFQRKSSRCGPFGPETP